MSGIFQKLPQEFATQLQKMLAEDQPATQIRAFIYDNMTAETAKSLGFSRTELYNTIVESRKNSRQAPPGDVVYIPAWNAGGRRGMKQQEETSQNRTVPKNNHKQTMCMS